MHGDLDGPQSSKHGLVILTQNFLIKLPGLETRSSRHHVSVIIFAFFAQAPRFSRHVRKHSLNICPRAQNMSFIFCDNERMSLHPHEQMSLYIEVSACRNSSKLANVATSIGQPLANHHISHHVSINLRQHSA